MDEVFTGRIFYTQVGGTFVRFQLFFKATWRAVEWIDENLLNAFILKFYDFMYLTRMQKLNNKNDL